MTGAMNDKSDATTIDDSGGKFLPTKTDSIGAMAIATSRAAQEVQAAMVIAKKFPRDEAAAYARIMQACQRKGLAEEATYAYKRGGSMVTGPSIRLAEALAGAWGNMDSGVIELEQKNGESQVMAYAWDLESNRRETIVFTVPHKRVTKQGEYPLTDPRDVYELVMNQAARRLRACILKCIPADVRDDAVRECEKTLSGGGKEPIADRVRKMVTAFVDLGVTQEMIEARLTHPIGAIAEAELAQLRSIYTSLRDGVSRREDWFTLKPVGDKPKDLDSLTEKMSKGKKEPEPENDFPPME